MFKGRRKKGGQEERKREKWSGGGGGMGREGGEWRPKVEWCTGWVKNKVYIRDPWCEAETEVKMENKRGKWAGKKQPMGH